MQYKDIKLPDFKRLKKPALIVIKYGGIAAGILLVIFMLFDRVFMPAYTRHGTEFPLPNLVNKSYDDALAIAERYDFEIVVRGEQPSPTIPEGTILSQVPSAGTQIKENRNVKVIISAGEQMVEVPTLTRLSVRQAELELPEYGLKISNYYWTESDSLARDVVAYTVPPSGSLVPKGSGIDLYINRGKQTSEGYMPKLVGKPLDEALSMLDSLGFPKPRVEYVTNPLLLPQIVTYQHPAAGSKTVIDSTNILIIVPVGE
jgi:beta-lactam-binding protein with PASTA domain